MRRSGMIDAVNRARRLAYPLTVAVLLGGCASPRSVVTDRAPSDRPIATPAATAPAAGRPAQVLAVQDGIDLGSTGRLGVSPWRPSPAPTGSHRSQAGS
jgi:hypothetical protein